MAFAMRRNTASLAAVMWMYCSSAVGYRLFGALPGSREPARIATMSEFFERRHMRLHEAERAFVQRGVDDLPAAGLVPRLERDHRPERRIQAGDVVGDGGRDAAGRTIGVAGDMADAADRLANDAVAGPLAVGPVCP